MCPLQRSGMCLKHKHCPLIAHSGFMIPRIAHDFPSERVPLFWFSF